ncbi:MAG: hypothetical protein L0226_15070 [Acidobacteria bacterium]|nr:hypothetical protein [Acidobacteriota bacterium]
MNELENIKQKYRKLIKKAVNSINREHGEDAAIAFLEEVQRELEVAVDNWEKEKIAEPHLIGSEMKALTFNFIAVEPGSYSHSLTFEVGGPIDLQVEWGSGVTSGSVALEIAPAGDSPVWKIVETIDFNPAEPVVKVSFDDDDNEVEYPVGRICVTSLSGGAVGIAIIPK